MGNSYVFLSKGRKCVYCGDTADTIDHVIPKSKGGSNSIGNLVPACKKCNLLKSDRDLDEFLSNRKATPVSTAPTSFVLEPIKMEPLKQDYYSMELDELDTSINNMRSWFWRYPRHEQSQRVLFALTVALTAKEIYSDRKNDPWTQDVVEIFTKKT